MKTSSLLCLPDTLLAGKPRISSLMNPELVAKDTIFAALEYALDSAMAMGVEYCEVSFDKNIDQVLSQRDKAIVGMGLGWREETNIGIRVFLKGSWGHASSNQFEKGEIGRITDRAVAQARANSQKKVNVNINWGDKDPVIGEYITPGIDPLSIPVEEKIDFVNSWRASVLDYRSQDYSVELGSNTVLSNQRNERGYVNSHGSKQYAITYRSFGFFSLGGRHKRMPSLSPSAEVYCRGMDFQQGGWEVFRDADVHGQIPYLIEKSAEDALIGISPVDVGRYTVVMNAPVVARIVGDTLVRGAELDRILGYEANATGTSFLGPNPYDHLGQEICNQLLTISANRLDEKGLASIPWDAEGVPVKEFDIVRDGVLVDLITNRETSFDLNKWYSVIDKPYMSNGCSSQQSSAHFPLSSPPNIKIASASEHDYDEADMISEVDKGYYISDFSGRELAFNTRTSFQRQDGIGIGTVREIVNGKLGNHVYIGMIYNIKEMLKGVASIGGERSVIATPLLVGKGQPRQNLGFTMSAPAMAFSNMAIIDPSRKS